MAEEKSAEIRSDSLINRGRLPEVAIRIRWGDAGRKDRALSGQVCKWVWKGRCSMELGVLEATQRVASAPKLHSRYSEKGLCSPRSRPKERAGLLDGVSQSQGSFGAQPECSSHAGFHHGLLP